MLSDQYPRYSGYTTVLCKNVEMTFLQVISGSSRILVRDGA